MRKIYTKLFSFQILKPAKADFVNLLAKIQQVLLPEYDDRLETKIKQDLLFQYI